MQVRVRPRHPAVERVKSGQCLGCSERLRPNNASQVVLYCSKECRRRSRHDVAREYIDKAWDAYRV